MLEALATTCEPVTGNQLAGPAGRSDAQVHAAVHRMVDDGLVHSARFGRTTTFVSNRDYVLAHGALRLLAAPGRVESEFRQMASPWDPSAETVAFVGHAAHSQGWQTPPDRDIELLVIRADTVNPHAPRRGPARSTP